MIICYLPLTDPPENGALCATVSHALRLCSYGTSAPGWCFARRILNTMEIHEFLAPWNGYTWFVKGNILPAQLFVTNIWLNKNSGKTSPKQCFQVTCATWGGSSFSCDQGPHVLGHPKNDLGSAVPVELPKLLSTSLVNFSNPDTSKQRRRTTGELNGPMDTLWIALHGQRMMDLMDSINCLLTWLFEFFRTTWDEKDGFFVGALGKWWPFPFNAMPTW